jgi:hypothetical protein
MHLVLSPDWISVSFSHSGTASSSTTFRVQFTGIEIYRFWVASPSPGYWSTSLSVDSFWVFASASLPLFAAFYLRRRFAAPPPGFMLINTTRQEDQA